MAENEWYEKHEKDVAAALKKGRGAYKDQAVSCTLVRMKDGAFLLCAHVSDGKATALVKEARSAGGKIISAGRLYAGADGPTFEVAEGDLSVKAKFAAAAAALGAAMTVVVIGPPTPAPGQAAPAAPAVTDMAAVQTALAKLVPAVQKAVIDHPDHKNELLAPLARCQHHIKDNQPVEAKAALVEVAHILKGLAPATDGHGTQGKPEAPPVEKDEFKELYNGLLETVPGDLQRLRQANPTAADKIQKVVDGAAVHAQKGEFREAFTYLNRAAEAMAKALGAGSVKEAVEVIPEGKVEAMKAALSRAQNKWDAAVTAARNRLKPVQAALQADFPSAAKGVNNILDSYEQELLAELRAGQAKADGDGLAAAVRGTLAKVQSLRAEATGDAVFSYLEECGVPVKAAFVEAFDEVESLLQA